MLRDQTTAAVLAALAAEDPYLWLEEVTGDQALDWVRTANALTAIALEGSESYEALEAAILDSTARLPYLGMQGAYYYNCWCDAANPRGLWRRTILEEFRKPEQAWERGLDLDALDKLEQRSWVFRGAQFLAPEHRRCLIVLSPGGSVAVVVWAFDVATRTFVPDVFELPLAKTEVSWIDADTLFVGTDFGPGSMTTSGYPRQVKLWRRGTPLDQDPLVFEGVATDLAAGAYHDPTPGFERDFLFRKPSFFTGETFFLVPDGEAEAVR